jgi:hypothetical protein
MGRNLAVVGSVLALGLCWSLANAISLPLRLDEFPDSVKGLVPEELKTFLAGLSDADRQLLKALGADGDWVGYSSVDQALQALKKNDSALYEKAKSVYEKAFQSKIAALTPEAKSFADGFLYRLALVKPAVPGVNFNRTKLQILLNETVEAFNSLKRSPGQPQGTVPVH